MSQRTLAFFTLAGLACGDASAHADSVIPRYKQFTCYGVTDNDSYSTSELKNGAYGSWCYDDRGKPVAKMHHGEAWASLPGTLIVSFTHYDDRNKVDGTLTLRFKATEETINRVKLVPAYGNRDGTGTEQQAIVALEVPEDDIDAGATGWFAGTVEIVNRTNVKIDYSADRVVVYNNFSSFTFLQGPVTIAP